MGPKDWECFITREELEGFFGKDPRPVNPKPPLKTATGLSILEQNRQPDPHFLDLRCDEAVRAFLGIGMNPNTGKPYDPFIEDLAQELSDPWPWGF